jgi:hypothetical protein
MRDYLDQNQQEEWRKYFRDMKQAEGFDTKKIPFALKNISSPIKKQITFPETVVPQENRNFYDHWKKNPLQLKVKYYPTVNDNAEGEKNVCVFVSLYREHAC